MVFPSIACIIHADVTAAAVAAATTAIAAAVATARKQHLVTCFVARAHAPNRLSIHANLCWLVCTTEVFRAQQQQQQQQMCVCVLAVAFDAFRYRADVFRGMARCVSSTLEIDDVVIMAMVLHD